MEVELKEAAEKKRLWIERLINNRVAKFAKPYRSLCLEEALCSQIGIDLAYNLLCDEIPQEHAIGYLKQRLGEAVKQYSRYGLYCKVRIRFNRYELLLPSMTKQEFDAMMDVISKQNAECDMCQRIYGHAITTAYMFGVREKTGEEVGLCACDWSCQPLPQYVPLDVLEEHRRLRLQLFHCKTICSSEDIQDEMDDLLNLVDILPDTLENIKMISKVWQEFLQEQQSQYFCKDMTLA